MSASRLSELQFRSGLNSDHFFISSSDLRSRPLQFPSHTMMAAIDNYVIKKKQFESSHVSLLRNWLSSGDALERVGAADVIHLHWPVGLLGQSFGSGVLNGKKVVMTLHDDFLFTGFCHSAGDCQGYVNGCKRCPLVAGAIQPWISAANETLRKCYRTLTDLQVLVQSKWMLNRARQSNALSEVSISLIPNVLSEDFMYGPPVTEPDNTLGLIATDISDPNKRAGLVIELAKRFPLLKFELIGSASLPLQLPRNVKMLGRLDSSEISRRASHWQAGLVLSKHENAPTVISELACLGVPTISTPSGAIREMSENYGFPSLVSSGDDLDAIEVAFSHLATFLSLEVRNHISSRAKSIHSEAKLLEGHLRAYGLA